MNKFDYLIKRKEQNKMERRTFAEIRKKITQVKGADPVTRAEYMDGIEAAKLAAHKAYQAKENAETEAEFDRASDEERHAKDKEAFFRRRLDLYDHTPRMEEAAYYAAVDAIRAEVSKEAAEFRRTAEKAMKEIIAARASYIATAKEANEILQALDSAANVLQSRYRYRVTEYTGGGQTRTEDPNEWTRHAVRYIENGEAYRLAAEESKICAAAWHAAAKVEKED